jgi:hypothetical protein
MPMVSIKSAEEVVQNKFGVKKVRQTTGVVAAFRVLWLFNVDGESGWTCFGRQLAAMAFLF